MAMTQRDMMRNLIAQCGRNEEQVCSAYAAAERRGDVERDSNEHGLTPEQYARALWQDGERKGWFRARD